jgi:hypothetical protein
MIRRNMMSDIYKHIVSRHLSLIGSKMTHGTTIASTVSFNFILIVTLVNKGKVICNGIIWLGNNGDNVTCRGFFANIQVQRHLSYIDIDEWTSIVSHVVEDIWRMNNEHRKKEVETTFFCLDNRPKLLMTLINFGTLP